MDELHELREFVNGRFDKVVKMKYSFKAAMGHTRDIGL